MYAEISQIHIFLMSLYDNPKYTVFKIHWFFLSPKSALCEALLYLQCSWFLLLFKTTVLYCKPEGRIYVRQDYFAYKDLIKNDKRLQKKSVARVYIGMSKVCFKKSTFSRLIFQLSHTIFCINCNFCLDSNFGLLEFNFSLDTITCKCWITQ